MKCLESWSELKWHIRTQGRTAEFKIIRDDILLICYVNLLVFLMPPFCNRKEKKGNVYRYTCILQINYLHVRIAIIDLKPAILSQNVRDIK